MKQLTFIVPGLSNKSPELNALLKKFKVVPGEVCQDYARACLQHLLEHTEFDSVIASEVKHQSNLTFSLAEISASQEGLNTSNSYWLRADPVELKADLAALYMYGNQHFELEPLQVNKIKKLVEPLLTEYDLKLHTPHSKRWYLESKDPINMQCINPQMLTGKDVMNFLPSNTDGINWQILQTEIQMCLHQVEGIGLVNSLWFWGGGEKPQKSTEKLEVEFYSNEWMSSALMSYYGARMSPVPKNLKDVIASEAKQSEKILKRLLRFARNDENRSESHTIIFYDQLLSASNEETYQQTLKKLLDKFLMPAFKALKKKRINKIVIDDAQGCCYQLKKPKFFLL